MKFYVIHYTKYTERRERLEKQLKEFNIEAEWIEECDKEDPIITKIKELTNSPLDPSMISCNMKHFIAMDKMVKEGIEEAVILEDDVVLLPEFKDVKMYHPSGLLRLGLGVGILENECPPPSATRAWLTSNPGGSEATWITKEFAEVSIDNVNFDRTIDMIQFSILKHFFYEDMRCMNTCYQTSLKTRDVNEPDGSWSQWCRDFLKYKRYKLSSLL
jgi:Glycosyltransferase family 25 (LPS biosynthesis protein)